MLKLYQIVSKLYKVVSTLYQIGLKLYPYVVFRVYLAGGVGPAGVGAVRHRGLVR